MKLARRSKGGAGIPTASMSDIAFLLILFFMVTTVFSTEQGLKLTLPKAEATQRIRLRRNTTNVWIDREGRISIDDKIIPDTEAFGNKLLQILAEKPDLVVLLRVDKNARYGQISDLIEKMKEVKALKLTFATQFEEL
jgi:biopolymer transport protein ExbD